MAGEDPHDLRRFVNAQASVYEQALAELKAGAKRSHWMWFIFPQARGLGHSPMAQHYGIGSLEEARAYLEHPLLGPRLETCTGAVLACDERPLRQILGAPDDVKFISSMSLFRLAQDDGAGPWQSALDRWNAGELDALTVELLAPAED
jgi:uncharacterized protein (DUF1810 family)